MNYWDSAGRWINTVLLVVVGCIGFDTLFRLLEANPQNAVVGLVRVFATLFLSPFDTMFGEQDFLLTALIAVLGYALLAGIMLAVARSIQATRALFASHGAARRSVGPARRAPAPASPTRRLPATSDATRRLPATSDATRRVQVSTDATSPATNRSTKPGPSGNAEPQARQDAQTRTLGKPATKPVGDQQPTKADGVKTEKVSSPADDSGDDASRDETREVS